MVTVTQRRKSHYGGSRLPAVLALLILAGGGILAYRHFFQRQGEGAINLIPADALMLVTLDTEPSPAQLPTYRRIAEAADQEHLGNQFDQMMTRMQNNSTTITKLRPYLASSFAAAALKGATDKFTDAQWVVLAALKNTGKAREILDQNEQRNTLHGLNYWKTNDGSACATLINNYIVASDKPEVLARVAAVQHGEATSVAEKEGYREARASLPGDANLMFFITPEGLKDAGSQLNALSGTAAAPTTNMAQNTHWLSIGVTLRPEGIDTRMQWPVDPAQLAGLTGLKAVDSHLFNRLPAGAYGLMALSQPDKYYQWTITNSSNTPETRRQIDNGVKTFEQETGMNVAHDMLPAFDGDCALLVYPDAAAPTKSVDGLIVLDDANGADPSALLPKVRAYIERASARDHSQSPVHFNSEQRGAATIWSVDSAGQSQIRQALSGVTDSAMQGMGMATSTPPSGFQPGSPSGLNGRQGANSGNMFGSAGGTPSNINRPAAPHALDNKTLVFAQLGKAVLIASSRPMLDRALDAYAAGTGGLASMPAYKQMLQQAVPDSQSIMMVDLPGIMNALRPILSKAMANSHTVTVDDIAQLFGHATGMSASQQNDGKVVHGAFFLPLDYVKLIHIMGASQRAMNGAQPQTAPSGAL